MRKTIVLASAVVLFTTLSAFSCHKDTPANNASADAGIDNGADANLAVADDNVATVDNAAAPTVVNVPMVGSAPPPPAPVPGNPDNRHQN
jgi:hypothetical protein